VAYRTIIADTSAIYALVDSQDAHHARAVQFWNELPAGTVLLIAETTLMEAMTLIEVRLGHRIACRALEAIRKSERYRVVNLTAEDRLEMWRIFEQYSDKEWSPFDCASLAIAKRREIQEAFAFDVHFDQMAAVGLLRVPPKVAR
jgi:uncharacterized protein